MTGKDIAKSRIAYYSRTKLPSIRRSAEKRKVPFTITLKQLTKILVAPCVYGDWVDSVKTPVGLDRRNSARGYTIRNSQPCCAKHNSIKGNWFDHTEMMSIARLSPLLRACGRNGGGHPKSSCEKKA
jgi:hypothetical protein